jgi:NADPH:quinone reductase-like Zn-dependent oxidoreductase
MKAIVQDRYGSPDTLRFSDVGTPSPGPGEILVRVHAAAVNAYDWHVMRGDPLLARLAAPAVFGLTGPKVRIRGRDFAGRVEAAGAEVTRFAVGDDVYGDLGDANGAFAEYVAVPAELAVRKPATLSFEQAAAVPLAGNTALMGLRDAAGVRSGQRVLINGASGGVGTFAVQIAKAFGAEVTAVCSTRNADLVSSIGADHVIDYTRADFSRDAGRYDTVFDLVGNRSLSDCRRALTPAGTLVLSGGGPPGGTHLVGPMGLLIRAELSSRFVRHRIVRLATALSRDNLEALSGLAEDGSLRPVIDRTYPLSEVPAAIRYVEQEHPRAKVVIAG